MKKLILPILLASTLAANAGFVEHFTWPQHQSYFGVTYELLMKKPEGLIKEETIKSLGSGALTGIHGGHIFSGTETPWVAIGEVSYNFSSQSYENQPRTIKVTIKENYSLSAGVGRHFDQALLYGRVGVKSFSKVMTRELKTNHSDVEHHSITDEDRAKYSVKEGVPSSTTTTHVHRHEMIRIAHKTHLPFINVGMSYHFNKHVFGTIAYEFTFPEKEKASSPCFKGLQRSHAIKVGLSVAF